MLGGKWRLVETGGDTKNKEAGWEDDPKPLFQVLKNKVPGRHMEGPGWGRAGPIGRGRDVTGAPGLPHLPLFVRPGM